jgi:hypothetical protein
MRRQLLPLLPDRGLVLMLLSSLGTQVNAAPCDEAWAAYNEFTSRTVMEPAQYPLTVQGAQVRAACGANALPVPPGSDVPMYRPHVRPVPVRPGQSPSPSPTPRPAGATRAP